MNEARTKDSRISSANSNEFSERSDSTAKNSSKPKPYYDHAGITIYHGDAVNILPLLSVADLILTDPPYNVSLGSKAHAARQTGYINQSDAMTDLEYSVFIDDISRKCISRARTVIVTPGNSNQTFWPKPLWTMAWIKANGVTRTPLTRGQKMNHACWEPILVFGKLDNPPRSDVISMPIAMQIECEGHPCPKPLALFSRLLRMVNCASVIDPFLGSGTTLRAAKQFNITGIGIDIEERYCELAAKRLSQEVFDFSESSK